MKKDNLRTYLPYILFLAAALLLSAKAVYSFCWSDETFYFATADRFFKGDSIFKNDWFPTQLSAIILLPIYSLFVSVTGSVDGVILFFRLLYVVFELISALVVYRIVKDTNHSQIIAVIASLCTMFYTHLNIATLSYYTISVHCFLLSMLLVYYYYFNKSRKTLIIAGVVFAISVLALPTMAVAYVLIVIGCFILAIISSLILKRDCKIKSIRTLCQCVKAADIITVFKFTLVGIIIPAVIFFIFLLSNVSVKDFIAAIPYVLSDEEHITSLTYPLRKFFIGINEIYSRSAYVGYLLIIFTFFFQKICRKKPLCYIIPAVDILLFIIYAYYSFGCTGYIQTALCLFALPLFFMTEKKDYRIFFLLFASGMIFSLVYSYSSNGYLYILSMGHFIAGIGSLMFISDYLAELSPDSTKINYVISAMAIIIVLYFGATTMALRMVNIYRDAPISDLNVQITQGPAAGLYTTKNHAVMYADVYNTLVNYCQSDNKEAPGSIFITKLLPWGYMCTDMKCASPTTWRTAFNSVRLEPYYEMNPDRYPDKILVLNEEYGSYDTCGDVVSDPNPNLNETTEGYLLKYITENNYSKTDVKCGVLYTK